MLDTIRAVHAGQQRIPPEIASEMAEYAADDSLTAREIEVLQFDETFWIWCDAVEL
jgi:DNA-binding NarL/FixJ family response regulator